MLILSCILFIYPHIRDGPIIKKTIFKIPIRIYINFQASSYFTLTNDDSSERSSIPK